MLVYCDRVAYLVNYDSNGVKLHKPNIIGIAVSAHYMLIPTFRQQDRGRVDSNGTAVGRRL